ncbi:MAG TPA: RNA-binding protein [Acetobacteraceae bacterium]|jgi:RNA recognition motif-containing protein|nr:RNA-binding protein [Acetobacteraceae bacterium]
MRPERIQGNIFVANLPVRLTDEQLAELFDPYGMVLRAYLARDPATGETRGHGLVQLAPERAVDEAIAAVNGQVLQGRRIDARRADPDMSLVLAGPGEGRGFASTRVRGRTESGLAPSRPRDGRRLHPRT